MALVGKQHATEVAFGTLLASWGAAAKPFATTEWRQVKINSIDPLQRAVGSPSLQQGAIHREVLRTQQRLDFRGCQQEFEELGYKLLVQESVTVLGECGRITDGIIGIEAHERAKQQVVVQLLQQHPLGSNAVDRLQQQGQQQLLRRNGGPASLGVKLAERGIEPIKSLIGQPPQLLQGWEGGIRSSVKMYENRGPVHSCWPRIPSMPLHHSLAVGWLFKCLQKNPVAEGVFLGQKLISC